MASRSLVGARVIPGLILAAVGVVLLLSNLGLVSLTELLVWWPMLLLAFGLHVFFNDRNRLLGLALIGAGALVQLRELELFRIQWRAVQDYWPLLLIVVGLSLILRRGGRDSTAGGVVLTALGAYFLASNFGYVDVPLWRLWPVALIGLGFEMARRSLQRS